MRDDDVFATEFQIANVSLAELPPPGGGFVTTMGKLPADAKSEVVKVIFSCPELTKLALCGAPLKVTVEDARNPVPLTVRVCELAPAVTNVGETD